MRQAIKLSGKQRNVIAIHHLFKRKCDNKLYHFSSLSSL